MFKAELQAMVSEIDKDGNGEIDFEGFLSSRSLHTEATTEFVGVMSKQVRSGFTPDKLLWAFRQFEVRSNPGKIPFKWLTFVLANYGKKEKMSIDDAEDIVAQVSYQRCIN